MYDGSDGDGIIDLEEVMPIQMHVKDYKKNGKTIRDLESLIPAPYSEHTKEGTKEMRKYIGYWKLGCPHNRDHRFHQ